MKRFHVHVAVPDLSRGIDFYSNLFGAEPSVLKDDYAKWMLDDPRLNFAISQRGGESGINHLGFQVDEPAELEEIHSRIAKAESSVLEERDVSCCYARSDKYWVTDPAGVPWESFRSLGTVPFYNGEAKEAQKPGCCTPREETAATTAACCG